jgi:hypothetical protein
MSATENIVVKGDLLGGATPANDATLTIAGAVDFAGFNEALASVTEASAGGAGSAMVTIHSTGTGGAYTFTVTTPGSDYVSGDALVILGTALGGVDGTNDCTITTNAAGAFAGTASGTPAAISTGLSATNVAITGGATTRHVCWRSGIAGTAPVAHCSAASTAFVSITALNTGARGGVVCGPFNVFTAIWLETTETLVSVIECAGVANEVHAAVTLTPATGGIHPSTAPLSATLHATRIATPYLGCTCDSCGCSNVAAASCALCGTAGVPPAAGSGYMCWKSSAVNEPLPVASCSSPGAAVEIKADATGAALQFSKCGAIAKNTATWADVTQRNVAFIECEAKFAAVPGFIPIDRKSVV